MGADAAPLAEGFPPISRRDARVLVLGSMPGVASLDAGQYYAHPRNLFWPLMAEFFGFDGDASYRARSTALRRAGVAVWDVMHACRRAGSLDVAIDDASIVVNDFPAFFARHPRVTVVCLNGGKAAQTFRKHALPELERAHPKRTFDVHALPSTSPANAGVPLERKRCAWRDAFSILL